MLRSSKIPTSGLERQKPPILSGWVCHNIWKDYDKHTMAILSRKNVFWSSKPDVLNELQKLQQL